MCGIERRKGLFIDVLQGRLGWQSAYWACRLDPAARPEIRASAHLRKLSLPGALRGKIKSMLNPTSGAPVAQGAKRINS